MMRFFYAPLLVAMMWSSQGLAQQTPLADGVFALVNDQVILQSELAQAKDELAQRYQAMGQPVNAERIHAEALELLLLRKLQLDVVKRAGVTINNAAVDAELANIATAQGFGSLSDFAGSLEREQKGAYQALRQNLIDELAVGVLQEHELGNRVKISDADIERFLSSKEAQSLAQDEYRTWHFRVPYTADKLQSEQVAADIYQALLSGQNLSEILATNQPLQVQGVDSGYNVAGNLPQALQTVIEQLEVGQVISFGTPNGVDVIKLIDKRKAQILMPQWQVSHILIKGDDQAAANKIAQLYAALQNGADFASLAKRHSEDTASAVSGGALGWVEEGQMVKNFEQVMKQTAKGDMSTPFTSQFGYHILKIDDKRERDVTEQYKKAAARQALFERLAPKAQEDWLQELKQNAYIKILSPSQ